MRKIPNMNCEGNHFKITRDTLLKKFNIGKGVSEEWHRDANTGEIVIIESWNVVDDEGDVFWEYEITEVIPKGGLVGELKRLIANN